MRISDWSSDVCSSDLVANSRLAKKLPEPAVWTADLVDLSSNCCHASFSTFTARTKAPGALNFILGSCRYPGVLWKVKEADLIFGPLRSEALGCGPRDAELDVQRSEEHTSELQSLMRNSYAVFCLK